MGPRGPVASSQEGTASAHGENPDQASESLTGERSPRRARLARGTDIARCWDSGTRVRTSLLDIAWHPNQLGRPRTGIIVPRHQQTAVARNRLRRRLREIMRRELQAKLPAVDLVVRAKRGAYAARFADLRAELAQATQRVG